MATADAEVIELLREIRDQQHQLIVEVRALRAGLAERQVRPASKAPVKIQDTKALEKLLPIIAGAMGDVQGFTSREIVMRARTDKALRKALQAACGDTARKVGDLLKRGVGATHSGTRIERVKNSAEGVLWAIERPVVMVTCHHNVATNNLTPEPGRYPMKPESNSGISRKRT